MKHANADGIIFIPEMMDEVVLKFDLGAPVRGRTAVAATVETLESFYQSQELLFESRQGIRDVRICKARLATGQEIELITVALRDPNGWVCELHLAHTPAAPVKALLAKAAA